MNYDINKLKFGEKYTFNQLMNLGFPEEPFVEGRVIENGNESLELFEYTCFNGVTFLKYQNVKT